jgi:hypothetical protein
MDADMSVEGKGADLRPGWGFSPIVAEKCHIAASRFQEKIL